MAEKDRYIELAKQTVSFIQTRKVITSNGICWSVEDAWKGKDVFNDEISLYTGSAGVIRFFLQLSEYVSSDYKKALLQDSEAAAQYILYRWKHAPELTKCFTKWAYTTGYTGIADVILDLYQYIPKPEYLEFVENVVNELILDAKKADNGVGYYWSSYPSIVGDGGIILFLLRAAEKLQRQDWKEFAVEAGRNYLNKGIPYGRHGTYYIGVDPEYFHAGKEYIDPNFPMGTAGVGYVLLSLYEASKDSEFLRATEGIHDFLEEVACVRGHGVLLPHALPDKKDLFYLGYCHGPAGTCRFYYKLYQITGDPQALLWCERFGKGIIAEGALEHNTEGYWNVTNFCCGSAGILNLFLGIWAATGQERWLHYAEKMGENIEKSVTTEDQNGQLCSKWYLAMDRIRPEVLTTPIGWYDGAAGIAAALIQLESAKQGKFCAKRAVDDPFPGCFEK